ncbi:MAG: 3-deoxy-manno-octulosonate cytidylyltransferase [Proteobacteria bacterium]|nr:3-deoxy-manno-octulosonate cytidylyltransferase [Pseudomonadota bacterium]
MNVILVIPARYESSRLPGKPLIPLLGISMIRRTFHRCAEAFPRDRIYVATDDQRVFDHCRDANINVVMTPRNCLSGTDRVACVAREIPADVYVNVQGDEPVAEPADIRAIIEAALLHPGEIINGWCPIESEELFRSPTIPKVVLRDDGRLLYMSRSPIPTDKSLGFVTARRQVCVYAFPREALFRFAAMQVKTELEQIEDIEILRFLEMGYEVRMIPLSSRSVAVDIPADIARAEAAILTYGLAHAG